MRSLPSSSLMSHWLARSPSRDFSDVTLAREDDCPGVHCHYLTRQKPGVYLFVSYWPRNKLLKLATVWSISYPSRPLRCLTRPVNYLTRKKAYFMLLGSIAEVPGAKADLANLGHDKTNTATDTDLTLHFEIIRTKRNCALPQRHPTYLVLWWAR